MAKKRKLPKQNWLCRTFSHKPPRQGWWGDALYGKVEGPYEDGIGRSHYSIYLNCSRCGQEYRAARFHGPRK